MPTVTLSFLLSQLGAHAAEQFTRLLEPVGLRPQDAGLLRMLIAQPGMTQIEVSEKFGVLPSRLVVLLDNLEKRQLIERRRDTTDRRLIHVFPTADGKRAGEVIVEITRALEAKLFSALSETEQRALEAALQKVVDDQQLPAGVHPAFRKFDEGRST